MISEQEKIFGCFNNKQICDLIIISVKDVIYQKRKTGTEMTIIDVKKCLLKNLSITKEKCIMTNDIASFENLWFPFIQDLRIDIHTRNSWYAL